MGCIDAKPVHIYRITCGGAGFGYVASLGRESAPYYKEWLRGELPKVSAGDQFIVLDGENGQVLHRWAVRVEKRLA